MKPNDDEISGSAAAPHSEHRQAGAYRRGLATIMKGEDSGPASSRDVEGDARFAGDAEAASPGGPPVARFTLVYEVPAGTKVDDARKRLDASELRSSLEGQVVMGHLSLQFAYHFDAVSAIGDAVARVSTVAPELLLRSVR
ncbi:hypothetical protein [Aquabacterium sp. OR-4]|uniref:hypothetical protein n=1 Tax=Aquabacterium sp. OR-4 TaxID=2978127 RepID=UPI0028C5302F|nr:hypothetical protein [Aquabacterium sp. OR-4]MDT7836366.1 hypothetical protein [Aquabacterium sp. OR-4]